MNSSYRVRSAELAILGRSWGNTAKTLVQTSVTAWLVHGVRAVWGQAELNTVWHPFPVQRINTRIYVCKFIQQTQNGDVFEAKGVVWGQGLFSMIFATPFSLTTSILAQPGELERIHA